MPISEISTGKLRELKQLQKTSFVIVMADTTRRQLHPGNGIVSRNAHGLVIMTSEPLIHKPGSCSTCLNITGVGNLFSFVKQTDKFIFVSIKNTMFILKRCDCKWNKQ